MRTALVKWGVTALLAVWLGSLGGSLRADPPETFEPGTGKYILVLKDPRTDADDPATGRKKAKEPDVAKHGGKVLKKKDAVRVIKLPNKAAKALRKEENVAYVQRVWMGESQDNWGEDELTSSLEAEADPALETLDTDLTWTTGQYLYDGSGNIKQIGGDTYRYDSAGRLIQAAVKGITETYKYDAFGNLTEKAISGVPLVNQVDTSSNRLKGEVYDAAGNLTTRAGAPRYQYDSLSMMDSVAKPGIAQTNRMIYGPDDERMAVIVEEGTLSRWKFRDFSGKVLREFKSDDYFGAWEWTEDYVNGEGKVLAAERESYFGGKRHFHTDHLGTVRMITDQNRMRLSVHDFYPFGVEQTDATQEYNRLAGTYGSGDFRSEPMKFTGHERDWHGWLNVDNDDYLDYMHARYYDPNMGRFLSVDPIWDSADLGKPQSWNRYAYVDNNPLLYVDPNGRYKVPGWISTAGSVGAGFIPVAGEIQDAGIALTGYDYMNAAEGQAGWGTRAVSAAALFLPFVGGKAISEGASAGARVVRNALSGRAFEKEVLSAMGLAGAGKTRIPSITGTAAYRVPDGLTARSLIEVKGVAKLGVTNQIKDFAGVRSGDRTAIHHHREEGYSHR